MNKYDFLKQTLTSISNIQQQQFQQVRTIPTFQQQFQQQFQQVRTIPTFQQQFQQTNIHNCRHCGQEVCGEIQNKYGMVKGVGVLIFNEYYDVKTRRVTPVVMFGKERRGTYQGEFNVCGGKMDTKDNGCVVGAILREMEEEFKLKLDINDFNRKFKNGNGRVRYFMTGLSVIFIGKFQRLSRGELNQKIIQDNRNLNLPYFLREMEEVEWFGIYDGKQFEGKNCKLSDYASKCLRLFDVKKL